MLLGSDPLSILQLYGMGQVTAFEGKPENLNLKLSLTYFLIAFFFSDGKNVIFGDLSWPKDIKTNFRMSG